MRPGGTQRTAVGVVGFGEVRVVARDAIGEDDATRAGFPDRATLLAFLDRRTAGEIHRVELRLVGPDPRVELRQRLPAETEMAQLLDRLARLDRSSRHGAWTQATLQAIAERPATRAVELAATLGRERLAFKLDVRKLKELGLTESLERGYRLSPRGRAVVDRLIGGGPTPGPPRTRPTQPRRRGGR